MTQFLRLISLFIVLSVANSACTDTANPMPSEGPFTQERDRHIIKLTELNNRRVVVVFDEGSEWQTAFYLDSTSQTIIPEPDTEGLPILFRDQTGTRYNLWGDGIGGGNAGFKLTPVHAGKVFFRTCSGMFPNIPLDGESDVTPDTIIEQRRSGWSIPVNSVVSGSAQDVIPAIDDPIFYDIRRSIEAPEIQPSDWVIGIVLDGQARAYPGLVLTTHEIVNDRIGDVRFAVTHSPLSGSARAYLLPTEVSSFGVSGMVWNANMLMFDRGNDRNLFSQITGKCVRGPLSGSQLTPLAYFQGPWKLWQRLYPRTQLLVPPAGFDRDVAQQLEATIHHSTTPHPFPVDRLDERLRERAEVFCVTDGERAAAFTLR